MKEDVEKSEPWGRSDWVEFRLVSKRDPGTRVSAKGKAQQGLTFVPILRTLARIQSCQSQEKEEVCVGVLKSCQSVLGL